MNFTTLFVLTALSMHDIINCFHFYHSVVLLVHISVSEATIVEGESTNVTVSYTGNLHSEITLEVNITTSARGRLSSRYTSIVRILSWISASLSKLVMIMMSLEFHRHIPSILTPLTLKVSSL